MKQLKLFSLITSTLMVMQLSAVNLTVNDIRNFTIDSNTVITLDGALISPSLLDIIGTGGYKIRFRINDDVNPTISQGTFSEINLISDIIAPITSTQPLMILDQEVFTTAATVLENINSSNQLVVGDLVKVSGVISAIDNSLELSRLELDNSMSEWKLRGFARNITATTFTIGDLTININGVTATNCANGFINNSFVSIKTSPDASYVSGQPLTTLTSIECQTPDVDEDSNNSIPVVVEGVISEFVDLVSFKINNLTVFFDATTGFDNGEVEHIDIGTKVEVQGMLDTNNRLIDAQTIRFIHYRVKIIAPVAPADITLNQSIGIMGVNVRIIPQTRDDNNIISSGLDEPRQIEVRGFVDSAGNIFAQRVKDKGEVELDESELRGGVTAINQPFITVLGITIDSTNSLFELDDNMVDMTTFFAQLQVGMQISIEDAIYDSSTNTLSFGEIEIEEQELEDEPDDNKQLSPGNKRDIIGTGGIGIATITGTEVIFNSSFE
ncbi:hypothetical protein MNBD_GAMMA01-712 [hydrothermal vent metagenome]|uniref:DUF5666 domain-containing protein n=1 Tax=hydrothermal vent metagenome TaxID=652676 RepID=A0A3B0VF24_9ZZZZ